MQEKKDNGLGDAFASIFLGSTKSEKLDREVVFCV